MGLYKTEINTTLYSSEELKIDMANMIGSLMVNVFTNFVANEVAGAPIRELPYLTSYDGNSMQLKIE